MTRDCLPLFPLFSGFSGKSINLYSYAANNPVMLKDPRGRCLSFATVAGGPLGAAFNAMTNVGAYVTAQRINNQKVSIGGTYSKQNTKSPHPSLVNSILFSPKITI